MNSYQIIQTLTWSCPGQVITTDEAGVIQGGRRYPFNPMTDWFALDGQVDFFNPLEGIMYIHPIEGETMEDQVQNFLAPVSVQAEMVRCRQRGKVQQFKETFGLIHNATGTLVLTDRPHFEHWVRTRKYDLTGTQVLEDGIAKTLQAHGISRPYSIDALTPAYCLNILEVDEPTRSAESAP